jgi:putative membrane protein
MGMGALKDIGVVVWCTGIAACIGLCAWSGIDAVGNAVATVGWGVPFVVLTRAAAVSVAGTGWWLLFPASGRLRLQAAVLLRFVREGVNALLPLTQVGGDIIGARLLTFWVVPGPLAAASIIIDVLMQAATQLLFAALGLVTLVALGMDMTLVVIAATGLAFAAPVLGGFYLAQGESGHRIVHFVLVRLQGDGNWRVLGTVDAVYQSLAMIYARRSNLVASGLVHMIGWLIGVTEVLIALGCMGHPVAIGQALVIESLTQAVRGAAFAIPSALGAQEAGLILLCGVFGIPFDQAVALSLIKRAADLVVGVPGLVALQILEGERLTANCSRHEGQPRVSIELHSEGH